MRDLRNLVFERIRVIVHSKLFVIALVVFSLVITLVELPLNAVTIEGDTTAPVADPGLLSHYITSWNSWADLGTSISQVVAGPPITDLLLLSSFRDLGLSAPFADWLYVASFSAIGACSTAYLFRAILPRYGKQQLACILAGLVFLINPSHIVDTSQSLWLLLPERSLFPLFLAIFIEGHQRGKLRYSFAGGLITLILFARFPVGTSQYGIAALLAITGYLTVALTISPVKKHLLAFSTKYVSVVVLVSCIVNLYLLYPILINLPVYSSTLSSFALTRLHLNNWSPLVNSIRLLSFWGFYNGYVPYSSTYLSNLAVILSTACLPCFAFGSLLIDRTKRVWIVGLVTTIGLFLAKGDNEPFGQAFIVLVSIPVFKAFYISSTIVPFIALLYSMLLPAFYGRLAVMAKGLKRLNRLFVVGVVFIIIVSTLMVASWPLITGSVSTNYYQPAQRGVAIPGEYASLRNWLASNGGPFRTLLAHTPSVYVSTNWGFQGSVQFYANYLDSSIVTGIGTQYSVANPFLSYVYDLTHFIHLQPSATNLKNATEQDWTSYQGDQVTIDSSGFQNGSAIDWTISTPGNMLHEISWSLPSAQDWSAYNAMSVWIQNQSDVSGLQVGVMDVNRFVGWFDSFSHMARANDGWTQVILPLQTPDVGEYNASNVIGLWARSLSSDSPVQIKMSLFQIGHIEYDSLGWAKLLGTMNVKWVLQDQSLIQSSWKDFGILDDQGVFKPMFSMGSLTLYSNQYSSEVIHVATSITYLTTLLQASDLISNSSFNPQNSVFIDESNGILATLPSNNTVTLHIAGTQLSGYSVSGYSGGTFVLVLDQQFDPKWELTSSQGQSPTHFQVNGYANAWLVSGSGPYDYKLLYAPETANSLVLASSIIATIAVAMVISVPITWARRFLRKLTD